ncbi:hypothetical protein LCGC14_2619000 [marine sediment metagenome]|uniref:Uncharacterized protein n=1 Tax=marine sediment metagenome TaxID=412755 RepID=A0A0F9CEL7_9ZZZZ
MTPTGSAGMTDSQAEFREMERFIPLSQMNSQVPRCIGCRYRTPKQFGGEGIQCLQKRGECPDKFTRWVKYETDEELLEALRL